MAQYCIESLFPTFARSVFECDAANPIATTRAARISQERIFFIRYSSRVGYTAGCGGIFVRLDEPTFLIFWTSQASASLRPKWQLVQIYKVDPSRPILGKHPH